MAGEKEKAKLPYLPVNVDDLTSDELVEAMTTEEFGAYVLLLCKAWKSDPPGTIPNDDKILARLTRLTDKRWKMAKERVLAPWKPFDGSRLYQKRLVAVHADVIEKVNKRKEAGAKGGKAKADAGRQQNPSNATAMPEQCYPDATSKRLANGYQRKVKVNTSVVTEVKPPTPFFDFEGCNPVFRTITIPADNRAILFEDSQTEWQWEFLRRWSSLQGVAKHSENTLSPYALGMLLERFREPDWDWSAAMAMFPINWPGPMSLITFLEPGKVQQIVGGKYRIPDFAATAKKNKTVDVHAGIREIQNREREKREGQMSEFGAVFENRGGDDVGVPAADAW